MNTSRTLVPMLLLAFAGPPLTAAVRNGPAASPAASPDANTDPTITAAEPMPATGSALPALVAAISPSISLLPSMSPVRLSSVPISFLPDLSVANQVTTAPLLSHFLSLGVTTAYTSARGFAIRNAEPTATGDLGKTLDPIPVVGSMYRRTGTHFNTDDGSNVNAFAICYRLNRRLGFQMVPGDPAPVKLAVTSLANNTGVTVGMTWKLSRKP